MKKFLSLLLIFALALSFAACGKKGGGGPAASTAAKDTRVDALDAFTGDTEAVYAVQTLEGPENIWLADSLAVWKDKVYFAGSFLEESYVYRAERDGSGAQPIASPDGLSVQDICAGSDALYLLADRTDTREPLLLKLDGDGHEQSRTALSGAGWPEGWWPMFMAWDDGMLYIAGAGTLCGVDTGDLSKPVFRVETSAGAKPLALPGGGVILSEGQEGGGTALRTMDSQGNLGAAKVFDLGFSRSYSGGTRWSVYFSDGSSLYGYDYAADKVQKLLSWQRAGLSGGAVLETGEEDFLCLASLKSMEAPRLLLMSKTALDPNAAGGTGPVTLILATMNRFHVKLKLEDSINTWNREHPECTIEVRDYSVYADGDTRAAELRLLADIASGNIPDLFDLSVLGDYDTGLAPFSTGLLARRGLLENLYPYIDSDGDISRDKLFPSVLRALEIGGCLYEIAADYQVITTFADPALLEGRSDWSYEALSQVVRSSEPYETLLDGSVDPWRWLELVVAASGDKLVDWTALQCHFDSAYFIAALEAAKAQPAEPEFIGGTLENILRNSTGLLSLEYMDTIYLVDAPANVWGPGFASLGLPEVGLAVYPELSLGMSAASAHKEACWQFLRQCILPDARNYGFSMNRERVQAQIAHETEQIQELIEYHPYTEEAMNRFLGQMDSIRTAYRYDAQLWQIVRSEAERFFAGQLSARETAANIQSRASIYMAEQA